MSESDVCTYEGLVLPLFGKAEQDWPNGLRIVLYMVGLFWCFMGVAIIADVFMTAIETVTAKKMHLLNKATGRYYTYDVWNPTLANLSLMALGSSAPEILLNVIDIFAKEFFLEGLGPSTIVGSAAFNLLMIIAVCIVAIPDGEVRYIKELPVYVVTAVCSIFAYVWLLVILMGTSPNVVLPWEGILTFLFFPILLVTAFAADKGYFGSLDRPKNEYCICSESTKEEFADAAAQIRAEHGQHLTDEQVARVMIATSSKVRSRAHYRIAAVRALFGGRKLKTAKRSLTAKLSKKFSFLGNMNKRVVPVENEEIESESWIQFMSAQYAVLESAGHIDITVIRGGDVSWPARAWYCTQDGTASSGADYKSAQGWIEFPSQETEATIKIKIVDDNAYEEDEDFYVTLSDAEVVKTHECKDTLLTCAIGDNKQTRIIIIDDDAAGEVSFENEQLTTHPQPQDYQFPIKVLRRNGGDGEVSVRYATEGASAVAGHCFEPTSGKLTFLHQQVEATIFVTIKAVARYDRKDKFRVIVSDPEGGVKLDKATDGGEERNIVTVTIEADDAARQRVDQIHAMLKAKWDKSKVGHASWIAQFRAAVLVNGGEDDDDDDDGGPSKGPSMFDYVSHFLALPWKLLFALVPPANYCGGWVCFCCALVMIGVVTMIIGDMASLLGCVLKIPDDITAITFVALGTSLPDTFASKTAATQDAHADASVGNVTGSNSVNVFLGLGLPWMIAAINWKVVDRSSTWDTRYQLRDGLDWLGPKGSRTQAFVVEAGNLGFSVSIFSSFAVLCISLLAVRRIFFGGELGGNRVAKWMSGGFLSGLWLLYIILSAWQSLSSR